MIRNRNTFKTLATPLQSSQQLISNTLFTKQLRPFNDHDQNEDPFITRIKDIGNENNLINMLVSTGSILEIQSIYMSNEMDLDMTLLTLRMIGRNMKINVFVTLPQYKMMVGIFEDLMTQIDSISEIGLLDLLYFARKVISNDAINYDKRLIINHNKIQKILQILEENIQQSKYTFKHLVTIFYDISFFNINCDILNDNILKQIQNDSEILTAFSLVNLFQSLGRLKLRLRSSQNKIMKLLVNNFESGKTELELYQKMVIYKYMASLIYNQGNNSQIIKQIRIMDVELEQNIENMNEQNLYVGLARFQILTNTQFQSGKLLQSIKQIVNKTLEQAPENLRGIFIIDYLMWMSKMNKIQRSQVNYDLLFEELLKRINETVNQNRYFYHRREMITKITYLASFYKQKQFMEKYMDIFENKAAFFYESEKRYYYLMDLKIDLSDYVQYLDDDYEKDKKQKFELYIRKYVILKYQNLYFQEPFDQEEEILETIADHINEQVAVSQLKFLQLIKVFRSDPDSDMMLEIKKKLMEKVLDVVFKEINDISFQQILINQYGIFITNRVTYQRVLEFIQNNFKSIEQGFQKEKTRESCVTDFQINNLIKKIEQTNGRINEYQMKMICECNKIRKINAFYANLQVIRHFCNRQLQAEISLGTHINLLEFLDVMNDNYLLQHLISVNIMIYVEDIVINKGLLEQISKESDIIRQKVAKLVNRLIINLAGRVDIQFMIKIIGYGLISDHNIKRLWDQVIESNLIQKSMTTNIHLGKDIAILGFMLIQLAKKQQIKLDNDNQDTKVIQQVVTDSLTNIFDKDDKYKPSVLQCLLLSEQHLSDISKKNILNNLNLVKDTKNKQLFFAPFYLFRQYPLEYQQLLAQHVLEIYQSGVQGTLTAAKFIDIIADHHPQFDAQNYLEKLMDQVLVQGNQREILNCLRSILKHEAQSKEVVNKLAQRIVQKCRGYTDRLSSMLVHSQCDLENILNNAQSLPDENLIFANYKQIIDVVILIIIGRPQILPDFMRKGEGHQMVIRGNKQQLEFVKKHLQKQGLDFDRFELNEDMVFNVIDGSYYSKMIDSIK